MLPTGEEFINWIFDRYCRDKKVQRSRSRPYSAEKPKPSKKPDWQKTQEYELPTNI